MADERVVSTKLEQIEQYHGELVAKRETLSRTEFLGNTTEQRASNGCSKMPFRRVPISHNTSLRTISISVAVHPRRRFVFSVGKRSSTRRRRTRSSAAVGFRNVLAHEYGRVDYVAVYETIQTGLEIYDAFSQQVAQWFRNQN